jgi:hypothetical protein
MSGFSRKMSCITIIFLNIVSAAETQSFESTISQKPLKLIINFGNFLPSYDNMSNICPFMVFTEIEFAETSRTLQRIIGTSFITRGNVEIISEHFSFSILFCNFNNGFQLGYNISVASYMMVLYSESFYPIIPNSKNTYERKKVKCEIIKLRNTTSQVIEMG